MKSLTPERFARLMADKAADDARSKFASFHKSWAARCESPIEEIMALAMIYSQAFQGGTGEEHFLCCDYNWPDEPAPFDGMFFYSQAAVGPYRVDFLIRVASCDIVKFIVVECDGHDFHERTKEQASRDRSRDRWMAAQGITVLRFTGSEIHKDALACAESVFDVICRLMGWGCLEGAA
jgi:very-short-patch-repair endonuclease